jgi:hypothetical protein
MWQHKTVVSVHTADVVMHFDLGDADLGENNVPRANGETGRFYRHMTWVRPKNNRRGHWREYRLVYITPKELDL